MSRRVVGHRSDEGRARPAGGGAPAWAGLPVLDRRSALKAIGGGIFVAAGSGLLGACSSSSSHSGASTTTAASSATSSGGSRTGGTLTVLIDVDPIALDPIKYNASTIERCYRPVVESLYEWTRDKTIVPLLASGMPQISTDGLTYTVPLRSDVTFHNGKAFGSDDVVYTYQQVMNPSNGSIWLPNLGKVKTVTATDPTTVTITLTEPFTPLLSAMALIPIVPSNIPYNTTAYARTVVGTGPFKFVSWQQGVALTYVKNDSYWDTSLPKSDKLVLSIVPDAETRIADLVGGTGQIMDNVQPKYVSLLKSKGMVVDVENQSSTIDYMYPNVLPGHWTANVNARLALAWAINRQEILNQVFDGLGVPESTLPMDGAQYYDPTVGRYFGSAPDLTKAKQYLQMAGGPPSKPLDLVILEDEVATPTAPIVQQNLEAIGVPVNLISLAETPALARLFSLQYDLFLLDVTAQQSTGYGSYIAYLAVFPGAFANFNKFNDPTMTQLVSTAVSVQGDAAQAAAWKAVQEYWVKVVPQIMFVTGRYVEAVRPNVSGYVPTGMTQLLNLKYASVT